MDFFSDFQPDDIALDEISVVDATKSDEIQSDPETLTFMLRTLAVVRPENERWP
jgi:hypothetical protein